MLMNSMSSVSSENFEVFEKRRFEKPEWYESDARYLRRLCVERDRQLVKSASIDHEPSPFSSPYYYVRFDHNEGRHTSGLLHSDSISIRSEIYALSRQREEEKKGKTVLGKFKKWMKHKDKAGKRSKEKGLVFKSKSGGNHTNCNHLDRYFKRLTCFAVQVDAATILEHQENDFLQEHQVD
ncbi:hypothetical protein K2173_006271 [Erythroxylum novogranatense]|uniref:Uncharacterized protein n=1 Tax=Erythroxylum novogranatense TaxID=1862640 RepID=A0AAV8TCK3_9ROSI|nr:hypothetical protein K2173_006271 [Erythroxylum novogranatense]